MSFNPSSDSIAVTVPYFSLLKSSDLGRGAHNEPYIVSVAIDDHGVGNQAVSFNNTVFPRMRPGDRIDMIGDGHLLYGPRNPGAFVAFSVLVLESDEDLDQKLAVVVKQASESTDLKTILAGIASRASAALAGVNSAMALVAKLLAKNKDDELFRTGGTLLRDRQPPYQINRQFTNSNEYVELAVKVIPLSKANGQGASVKTATPAQKP